jgi:pimeloyl-ACP methyl ester carboxylesterase
MAAVEKVSRDVENSPLRGASGEDPPPLRHLEVKAEPPDAGPIRVAYHHHRGAGDPSETRSAAAAAAVLFCGGFRSDMRGTKAAFLQRHCADRGLEYCRFDYRGHGQSTRSSWSAEPAPPEAAGSERRDGDDEDSFWRSQATIGNWVADTLEILDRVVLMGDRDVDEGDNDSSRAPPRPQRGKKAVAIVGSSMGAWIALHVAAARPQHVVGVVGVASAPDFTEDVWRRVLSDEQRRQVLEDGAAYLPSHYDPEKPYPITRSLVEEARQKWLLLEGDHAKGGLSLSCPVHLLHGKMDRDVSFTTTLELAEVLARGNGGRRRAPPEVRVELVEDGGHRLSRPSDLELLGAAVNRLLARAAAR